MMDSARTVNKRMLDPRLLSGWASFDVAETDQGPMDSARHSVKAF